MTIPQNDPFYSAKSSLLRAENHITDFDTAIWRYRDEHPPAYVTELDPDGRTQTLKFRFTEPFPQTWIDSATDALIATRSALDQACYAASKVSGNTSLRHTQFPIAASADDFDNLISGRKVCKDIPDAIVALIRRFKPYKGGNDTLWTLNKLRHSVHTELVPVDIKGGNVWIYHAVGSAEVTALNPIFDRTTNEMPFARVPADANLNCKAHPTLLIGFDHPEIAGRQHAVAFLAGAVSEVEQIVEAIETACCRLGFIDAA